VPRHLGKAAAYAGRLHQRVLAGISGYWRASGGQGVIGDLLGEEGALGFVSDQGQRLPDAAERGLTPDALATLRVLLTRGNAQYPVQPGMMANTRSSRARRR
jgi:hypothetical protein